MIDLPKRLRASLRCDAINGDSFERSVCAKQMREAADSLERADARIAELERECSQWRDELRIYRETESKRIAELEQSVTVRDTEIARLETDLELARRDAERLKYGASAIFQYGEDTLTGPTCEPDDRKWHRTAVLEMTRRAQRLLDGLPAIDAARAGNGESCDAV